MALYKFCIIIIAVSMMVSYGFPPKWPVLCRVGR